MRHLEGGHFGDQSQVRFMMRLRRLRSSEVKEMAMVKEKEKERVYVSVFKFNFIFFPPTDRLYAEAAASLERVIFRSEVMVDGLATFSSKHSDTKIIY